MRGDRVLHASHRIILLVGAEGHVIDTVVLQQDLHFSVLLLIMPTQHLQVFRQLAHLYPQVAVLVHQKGIVPERVLQMLLQLSDLEQPFLLNHWFVYVNRVFNWDFIWHVYSHWHFYDLFPFDRRRLYVDGLINVDWLFYDGRHLNSHSPYHLFRDFFHHLHYHLLLNFDILRDLHNLLNYPLRPGDKLWYFHNHLHWFLDDDFFDDFLWRSEIQPLDLIFPFFDQSFEHVQIHGESIILSL